MREHAGEVLTGAAALAGWGLLTWVAAELISWWAAPISCGLLLLSLVGWRLIGVVAWEGLYSLMQDDEEDR